MPQRPIPRSLRRAVLAAALLLLPLQPAAAQAPGVAPGGLAVRPVGPDEALPFLYAWARAQGDGDVAAYVASYDAARFQGVKRSPGSPEKRFDFAGWRADREPQVKQRPLVQLDFVTLTTPQPGLARVSFQQSYKLKGYEDHGRKRIDLVRGPDGKPRIAYEELETSTRGPAPRTPYREALGLQGALTASFERIKLSESDDSAVTSAVVLTLTGDAGSYALGLGSYVGVHDPDLKSKPGALTLSSWWAGAGDVLVAQLRGKPHKTLVITREEQDEGMTTKPRPRDYALLTLPPGATVTFSAK